MPGLGAITMLREHIIIEFGEFRDSIATMVVNRFRSQLCSEFVVLGCKCMRMRAYSQTYMEIYYMKYGVANFGPPLTSNSK